MGSAGGANYLHLLTHPTEKPSGMQGQKLIFHHHAAWCDGDSWCSSAAGRRMCSLPTGFIAMCNSSISFYQFSPLSNSSREPRTTRPSTQLYITLQFVVYLLKDMQIWLSCSPSPPLRKKRVLLRLLSFFICVDFFPPLGMGGVCVCVCVWRRQGPWLCLLFQDSAFCNCNSILTIFQLRSLLTWRIVGWWFVAPCKAESTSVWVCLVICYLHWFFSVCILVRDLGRCMLGISHSIIKYLVAKYWISCDRFA